MREGRRKREGRRREWIQIQRDRQTDTREREGRERDVGRESVNTQINTKKVRKKTEKYRPDRQLHTNRHK